MTNHEKLILEIKHIKERLNDLEAFRLKAYEKNMKMNEMRNWEKFIDADDENEDYDDYDDEEDE